MPRIFHFGKRNRPAYLPSKQCVVGLLFILMGAASIHSHHSLQASRSYLVAVPQITESSPSASTQSEGERHRDRPIFTLHVGPPKTANGDKLFAVFFMCESHLY
jgi:hypothetical protein